MGELGAGLFSPASSPLTSFLLAALVASAALTLGYLVIEAILDRTDTDSLTRWSLSIAGFGLYTTLATILHILTRGGVFSDPWRTRALSGFVFAALLVIRWRRGRRAGGRAPVVPTLTIAGLVLLGVAVWGRPVSGPLYVPIRGDMARHAGWAGEMLNGEPTPSATISGDVPNDYPWLFHSMTAMLSHFIPGGRSIRALASMQLLLVAGLMLALFGLGRELARSWKTGAAAALFGSLAGGFGFLLLDGADVVLQPRDEGLKYMGDLLFVRSYNFAFQNLAPPFPRDLSFALLPAFLLLLAAGLTRKHKGLLVVAGIVLGLVGLSGGETFVVGLAIAILMVLFGGMWGLRTAAALLAPALAVWGLWFLPVVVNYFALGGLQNMAVTNVDLPAGAILVSWGLVTPFALFGMARSALGLRDHVRDRVLLGALVVPAGAIAASSLFPKLLGRGFTTLSYDHRYWPLACFALALYAAVGLGEILAWLASRAWVLPLGLFVAVTAIAVQSPLAASTALPREIRGDPILMASLQDKPTVLNLLSSSPGGACVAAVPPRLMLPAFAYSGYRLVSIANSPSARRNPRGGAMVRWVDIYERITPQYRRARDNQLLTSASGSRERWQQAAVTYGVDVVVVPARARKRPAVRGYPQQLGTGHTPYAVIRVSDCGPS